MAYDVALSEAVLVGGSIGSDDSVNDTWAWDGTNWTQEFPAASPSARVWADMAYDPQQSQVVLFGGLNPGVGFVNDTWVYETPQVTASPASVNFGNVELCREKKVVVTLKNNFTSKVEIGPISFIDVNGNPADFSFHAYCVEQVKPGKGCTIAVLFAPDALTTDTATLNIVTSAPGSPLQVPITATGAANRSCTD